MHDMSKVLAQHLDLGAGTTEVSIEADLQIQHTEDEMITQPRQAVITASMTGMAELMAEMGEMTAGTKDKEMIDVIEIDDRAALHLLLPPNACILHCRSASTRNCTCLASDPESDVLNGRNWFVVNNNNNNNNIIKKLVCC